MVNKQKGEEDGAAVSTLTPRNAMDLQLNQSDEVIGEVKNDVTGYQSG